MGGCLLPLLPAARLSVSHEVEEEEKNDKRDKNKENKKRTNSLYCNNNKITEKKREKNPRNTTRTRKSAR